MIKKIKKINPLVIGLGVAGKRHLEAQLNQGHNVGIYDISSDSIKPFIRNAHIITFKNLKEAIGWSNLVHVCTPDNKHAEYVALAIRNRKVVFCEKPLTTNLKEALKLQNLAHKFNATVLVGQNYRLTPTFLETRKRIEKGGLGVITGIETTYLHDMTEYRMGTKWRNEQDFLYVGGSHAVDLAAWILDENIIEVQASVGKKIRSEYSGQERYQIILKFESGILGHVKLDASSARPINGTHLRVDGEKGLISSHNKQDELWIYKKGDKGPQIINFPNSQTHTIALEIKILNDYLSGKSKSHSPLPSVDEAIGTMMILDTIQRAVYSGKSETITYQSFKPS